MLPLTPHSQLSVIQLSSRAGLSPTVPPLPPLSITLTICGGAITDQISIQPPAGDHAPGAPSVWPLSPLLSLSMCCSQWWRDGHQVQTWPALTHMYCTPPHHHTITPSHHHTIAPPFPCWETSDRTHYSLQPLPHTLSLNISNDTWR